MMTLSEYRGALSAALDSERIRIFESLQKAMQQLPDKARGLAIGIHPDQEETGLVSVFLHADGPDLFVLNKAISDNRLLFDVVVKPDGSVSFDLPTFDPDVEEFSVGDTQVDAIGAWFKDNWRKESDFGFSKPVSLFGADGFGTLGVVKLN